MSLKRNVAANYLGQGWAALISLAFVPVYIRYLGIESFGVVGLLAIVQAWLTLLDMGMTPTLSREMARYTAGTHSAQSINDLVCSVEIVCFVVAAAACAAVWAVSHWLALNWVQASALSPETIRHAISLIAFIAAVRLPESIYRSALIGLQRQVWYNAANAGMSTLRAVGAVTVMEFVSPTIETFFVWQALMSALSVMVLRSGVYYALPRSPGKRQFSMSSVMDIWRFAAGMAGITALALVLTQIDKLLLSRLLPLEEFGIYTLATTLAGALFLMVLPVVTAVFPRLVELATEPDDPGLTRVYHQGAQSVAVAAGPIAMTLACFSNGTLFAWSGDASLAGRVAPLLPLLVVGTLLNGLMQIPYHLQLAYGWTGLTIKANLVGVMVLVPVLFWSVPRYGAIAAAWAWLGLNACYLLIAAQVMHRRLLTNEKFAWYLNDTVMPIGAALAAIFVLSPFSPMPDQNRWHWLGFLVVCTVFAYVCAAGAASMLRPKIVSYIRVIFTSLRQN